MKKKIIMIDDEPMMSTLMREVIEEDKDIEVSVMAITTEKEEFLELVANNAFDAALIDISVDGREGGIEILKTLKSRGIDLPSIVLSAHDEVSYALKCLEAGACGYVSKSNICADLIRALKDVLNGKMFVSGDGGSYILNKYKISHDIHQPTV